jgi:tyrosyl-DNA phosphodiesterase-1
LAHPNLTGHLSHSKVIIAYTDQVDDSSIIYLGSHNLSKAAWGSLTKNGSNISIQNYEAGVVLLPGEGTAAMKQNIVSDLPFDIYSEKYEVGTKPWIIQEHLG